MVPVTACRRTDDSAEGKRAGRAFAAGYLSPDDEPADTPFEIIFATDSGGETTDTATETMGTENETTTAEA